MEYCSAGTDVKRHEAVVSFSSPHSGTQPGQRERNTFQLSVGCICSRLHAGLFGGLVGFGGKGHLVQGRAEDLRMPGKEWGEHPLTLDKRLRMSSAGLGNMVSGETTKVFRSYSIAQGILLNVMWQPGWKGSLGDNGYMYMYV